MAPPRQAAHRHRHRRKHGVERAGFQIQSAHLGQVDKKPAEENPGGVAETKITERDRPHFPAPQNRSPGDAVRCLQLGFDREPGSNRRQLRGGYTRMLRRLVASHEIPDRARDQADDGTCPEGRSPAVVQHEVGNQRR